MNIHGIEEIPLGFDSVIGVELAARRRYLGVDLNEAADAIGAEARELSLLEAGQIRAFADVEHFRSVLIAYCDYLDIDAAPLTSRLEPYVTWGVIASPNLFSRSATRARARGQAPARLTLYLRSAMVGLGFAGVVILVWAIVPR